MAAHDVKLSRVLETYSVPYQQVAASSFNMHVMAFLSATSASLSRGSEHNLIGYLSILKQLLSATLTAFDVNVIPATADFVDFACSIFSGQPALCAQFWAWDATHPARGSLVQLVQSRYPYEALPCLKLMRALACEPNAAVHVLNAVHSLSTFTQSLPANLECSVADCHSVARVELSANMDSWLCCEQHVPNVLDLARAAVRGAEIVQKRVQVASDCIVTSQTRPDQVAAERSLFFPRDNVRVRRIPTFFFFFLSFKRQ